MDDLKFSLLLGTGFSGLAVLTVKLIGFNNTSFMLMGYGYVVLSAVLGLKNSGLPKINSFYVEVEDDVVKKIGKEERFTLRKRQ
ncbi:MAG: hypothetical protein H8Z69_02795 [Nanohaloarchaea archaeon]|nr:hypothetical protein [Candidatus Nanohaloarchaea archaeon]